MNLISRAFGGEINPVKKYSGKVRKVVFGFNKKGEMGYRIVEGRLEELYTINNKYIKLFLK